MEPGYFSGTPTYVGMHTAVSKQAAYAVARSRLPNWQSAPDNQMFLRPPVDDTGAAYRASYWLLVAARVTGQWDLARTASTYLNKAGVWALTPVLGSGSGNMPSILREAATRIQAAGLPDLAAMLDGMLGQTAAAQQLAKSKAPTVLPSVPGLPTGDNFKRYLYYAAAFGGIFLIVNTIIGVKMAGSVARNAARNVKAANEDARTLRSAALKHPELLLNRGRRRKK